jgi:hypothetical protein
MEYLTQLFLPVSIWFQSGPDWLFTIMKGISFLGNTEFYLLAMPLLYWCIDLTLGIRIGIILLVSGGLNNILKLGFASPRPFWVYLIRSQPWWKQPASDFLPVMPRMPPAFGGLLEHRSKNPG